MFFQLSANLQLHGDLVTELSFSIVFLRQKTEIEKQGEHQNTSRNIQPLSHVVISIIIRAWNTVSLRHQCSTKHILILTDYKKYRIGARAFRRSVISFHIFFFYDIVLSLNLERSPKQLLQFGRVWLLIGARCLRVPRISLIKSRSRRPSASD